MDITANINVEGNGRLIITNSIDNGKIIIQIYDENSGNTVGVKVDVDELKLAIRKLTAR